jgi:hypothetical protein
MTARDLLNCLYTQTRRCVSRRTKPSC